MTTTQSKAKQPKKTSTIKNKESEFSFFAGLMQPGFNAKRNTRRGKSEFKGFLKEGSCNFERYYLENDRWD